MKITRLLRRDPAAPTLRERAAALREGLSRREAVLGAAVVAAPLSAITGPAEAHPDAALISLWQRWKEAHRAVEAAAARWDAIEDAEGTMALPGALFVHDLDAALGIASFACRRSDGRMWYCVGEPGMVRDAAALRKPRQREFRRPVRPEDNLPAYAWVVVGSEPWPEAQARADQIVKAWDGWKAEIARQNRASGYDAAKVAWNDHDNILEAIGSEIAAAEARTITGLAIQGRVALYWDEGGFGDADALAAKIVRGLVSLDTPAA